jgi:hypothetical protein
LVSFPTLLCKWRSLEQHQQVSFNFKNSKLFEFFFLSFVFCLYLF